VLFAPFHWGGKQAANILTSATLDPISRMPEFKLTAVRVVASKLSVRDASEKRERLSRFSEASRIIGEGVTT
jgi:predicted molibdopterin-dependent oxidoreductase YjgC